MIRSRNLLPVLFLILSGLVSLSCRRGSSGPQPIEGVYHSDQVGDLEILKDGTFRIPTGICGSLKIWTGALPEFESK